MPANPSTDESNPQRKETPMINSKTQTAAARAQEMVDQIIADAKADHCFVLAATAKSGGEIVMVGGDEKDLEGVLPLLVFWEDNKSLLQEWENKMGADISDRMERRCAAPRREDIPDKRIERTHLPQTCVALGSTAYSP
jgi:hypothetical protein